jgi:hypothetical protein
VQYVLKEESKGKQQLVFHLLTERAFKAAPPHFLDHLASPRDKL